MTAAEIRQQFLNFFAQKQHQIVPSSPIVVKNDPTLMFTNAGMNQFKAYFLGEDKAPYHRAVDTQRCLRVSGKHNDLEEVGIDTYHHTMFEMLGNWSFGDYFKKEAIQWSWELLTEVYGIDKDRLYVTVFEGDASEGLPMDTEAYDYWKANIAEDRILKGNKKDNFWEMGETGPCGPCSEIHVDCRPDAERKLIAGATFVNADHPQVIEIWNNVFMQFNRLKDGTLQPLPATHVDTGMGFERLVRVLQQKTSNYDTDVFQPLIQFIEKECGIPYGKAEKTDIAMRVMADHIRAISFVIADGQLPSNTKAGYVIRRILRRAVRYAYTFLNLKEPFLNTLVPVLAQQFKGVFDELISQQDFVQKVVLEEEISFLRTLSSGIIRFEKYETQNQIIEGTFAFELYDTFGFPIDLTDLMAREKGWSVDMIAFEKCLEAQKTRSRAATAIDTEDWMILQEVPNVFEGYEHLETKTKVAKYRKVTAKGKQQYQLVLCETPFYAESGGQVGDKGILNFEGEEIIVTDTKKENDLIIHFVDALPKEIDAEVTAQVNVDNRLQITYNHTATHLMHAALKSVLGAHVAQKGSMVSADLLRFDFSHFSKLTDDEIAAVENIVNEKIRQNIPVVIKEMSKDEALALGATALFGEKYGDKVRVVTIDPQYSIELCGGTHVAHTGMLGAFTILNEAAVAAGVRRIEALTGASALQYFSDKVALSKQVTEILKAKNPIQALEKLLEDKAHLEKQIEAFENKELLSTADNLLAQVENIHQIQFLGVQLTVNHADALKKIGAHLKNKLQNFVLILTANIEGKAAIALFIDDKVADEKQLDAGKIVKQHIAALIKGGGGGQKTLATAGGQNGHQVADVITLVKGLL